MQNRTAKFVSAIFASLLAGMPLTTVSQSAVPAADDCLSKPKGQAPEGSHWYYHIDRVSKRHCWYLGDQRERLSRAKPQNTAPIADPASPQKETATQRPVTDAYAELPLPQTRVEQQPNASAWQRTPGTTANAASVENGQAANAADAKTQLSVIASRWPDPSGVSSSVSPAPTTGNSGEVKHRASATARRRPFGRGGPVIGETVRLGSDAVARHDGRTGACRGHGKHDFQVQQHTAGWPAANSQRSARDLGFARYRSPIASGLPESRAVNAES